MIFILFFFEYWWLILPVIILIAIPLYIYNKTIEISSKYTFTTFLIAWPLRLIQSCTICAGLILFSFLPVAVFLAITHTMVMIALNVSDDASKLILKLEFLAYFIFILNLTIGETLRNFRRELR